jgi:hypothetical protein
MVPEVQFGQEDADDQQQHQQHNAEEQDGY